MSETIEVPTTFDALLKAEQKALYEWYGEDHYLEQGYVEMDHEEEGGKHDCTSHYYVYKDPVSGRFVQLQFSTSYNNGLDDYSFYASEVYPHVVTTTVYKGTPAP